MRMPRLMKSVVSLKEGVAWGNRKLTERASRKTANKDSAT